MIHIHILTAENCVFKGGGKKTKYLERFNEMKFPFRALQSPRELEFK